MAFCKCYKIRQCISLTLLLKARIFSKSWKNFRPILLNSLVVLLSKIDAHITKTKIKITLSIYVKKTDHSCSNLETLTNAILSHYSNTFLSATITGLLFCLRKFDPALWHHFVMTSSRHLSSWKINSLIQNETKLNLHKRFTLRFHDTQQSFKWISKKFFVLWLLLHFKHDAPLSLIPFFNVPLLPFYLPGVSGPFYLTTFWMVFSSTNPSVGNCGNSVMLHSTQMSSSKLRLAVSSSTVKNSFSISLSSSTSMFLNMESVSSNSDILEKIW